MASRCAGVMLRAGAAPRKFTFRFIFPGGLPALPFRNLPKSGGYPGSYQGVWPRPGVPAPLGRRGAGGLAGGEGRRAAQGGASAGRVGNGGRPIARGHSPAPRDAQNNSSRRRQQPPSEDKGRGHAGFLPAPLGRGAPASFLQPSVRSLCQPRGRGSCRSRTFCAGVPASPFSSRSLGRTCSD